VNAMWRDQSDGVVRQELVSSVGSHD
jgi:hypothetical protein